MPEGLKENWQSLPKRTFSCHTTSSSGEDKTERFEGILLCAAAEASSFKRCTVRCEDGAAALFSRKDAENACLAERDGVLTLCFFRDASRKRWMKAPVSFTFE